MGKIVCCRRHIMDWSTPVLPATITFILRGDLHTSPIGSNLGLQIRSMGLGGIQKRKDTSGLARLGSPGCLDDPVGGRGTAQGEATSQSSAHGVGLGETDSCQTDCGSSAKNTSGMYDSGIGRVRWRAADAGVRKVSQGLTNLNEVNMKKAFAIVLLTAVVVTAQAQTKWPDADYPLRAHVRSVVSTTTHAGGVIVDSSPIKTGEVRIPRQTSSSTTSDQTQIKIGSILYFSDDICKAVTVGQDYPAQISSQRIGLLRLAHQDVIKVLVGNKVCSYGITGMEELEH
jgi:hypothetical protein